MKKFPIRSLNRTYSAPFGAVGLLILIYYSQLVEMIWVSSTIHFIMIILLILNTSACVTIIDYLTNVNSFEENKEKKKFIIYRILITLIICIPLIILFIVF